MEGPGAALLEATRCCDLRRVRSLLNQGASVEACGEDGQGPLHFAARWGDAEAIQELLGFGAKVNRRCSKGLTPLDLSATNSRVEGTVLLLERNAELGTVPNSDPTPLHYAARCGFTRVVVELVRRGADKTMLAGIAPTPLDLAIQWGRTESAVLLLEHKAWEGSASSRDLSSSRATPLHCAASYGSAAVVEALLARGARVDEIRSLGEDNPDGCTALHIASELGAEDTVLALLRGRADVNATRSLDGRTALHLAAARHHTGLVTVLRAHGAEASLEGSDGLRPLQVAVVASNRETAALLPVPQAVTTGDGTLFGSKAEASLHSAARLGDVAMTELLLQKDAQQVNAAAEDGQTALHVAAKFGRTEVVALLLRNGAEPNAVDVGRCYTPLHVAVEYDMPEVVRLLLDGRADPLAQNARGLASYDLAVRYGRDSCAELLLLGSGPSDVGGR